MGKCIECAYSDRPIYEYPCDVCRATKNGRSMYCPEEADHIANDVRPEKEGENITENNPVDEFVCSKCGIIIENWLRVEIDEDDEERTYHEYIFRFCPNCGVKVGGTP